MSFRGINPVANTVQIWDGTKWISFDPLQFTESGSDVQVTATGNLHLNASANVELNPTDNLSSASQGAAGFVNFSDYLGYDFAPTSGLGQTFSANDFLTHSFEGNQTAGSSFTAEGHQQMTLRGPTAAGDSNGTFLADRYGAYTFGTNHVAGSNYSFGEANAYTIQALDAAANFSAGGFGDYNMIAGTGGGTTTIQSGNGGVFITAPNSGLVNLNGNAGISANAQGPIGITSAAAPVTVSAGGTIGLITSGAPIIKTIGGLDQLVTTSNTTAITPEGNTAAIFTPGTVSSLSAGFLLGDDGSGSGNLIYIDPDTIGAPVKVVSEISADPAPTAAALEAEQITYACDVSAGAFTVTLPTPEPAAGTVINVKDAYNGSAGPVVQAATNNITVTGGADIDGVTNASIATDFGSLTIQSRGPGNGYMII